jgi:polyphosphate kinase
MFRRVETCFPIDSKKLHARVLKDLECYLKDNRQAWILQSDGEYILAQPEEGEEEYIVQNELLTSFQ